MSKTTLDDIINTGFQLSKSHTPALDDYQRRGLEYISKSINEGGLTIGIGPPGTGKTMVFSTTYAEDFKNIDENEIIVHVAPTNRLVEETAIRTIALLSKKGYNIKDLRNAIRVYGSHFKTEPISKDTKIVFMTGYQPRALLKLSELKDKVQVHIMIDEASTTPLHEAFIPLSMALANEIKNKNVKFIGSLNVIGDPMQAIVEHAGTRWKYEQLIVYRMILSILPDDERKLVIHDPSKLFELAEKYAKDSEIKYFFLNKTYRMPKPTEILVSIPFYAKKLEAIRNYTEALKDISSDSSRKGSFINQSRFLQKHDDVRNAIDNALESCIPIVYVRDKGFAYSFKEKRSYVGLDEYDELRSKLGGEIATYLAIRTCVRRVMLIAPYNEVVQQALWYVHTNFSNIFGDRVSCLSFGTVHSVLGSEADIVVAVLGKEYIGKQHETMYFQIPELVNVQLSRHYRMLIIIGNVEKLANNMKSRGYKYVGRITDAIEDLRNNNLIIEAEVGS